MKKGTKLFLKPREEYLVMGSERLSYSEDDVLVEDFYEQKGHPYAVYDRKGNLLETNLDCEKPMWHFYNSHIKTINLLIEEFGVNI